MAFLLLAGCVFKPWNKKENDITLNISNQVDDVILKYNDWGVSCYSYLQSDKFNITELFDGNLPKAGDTIKYYWKGKSNRDVSKLHMLVADIEFFYDEEGNWQNEIWTHLLTETQVMTPIKTNKNISKVLFAKETF